MHSTINTATWRRNGRNDVRVATATAAAATATAAAATATVGAPAGATAVAANYAGFGCHHATVTASVDGFKRTRIDIRYQAALTESLATDVAPRQTDDAHPPRRNRGAGVTAACTSMWHLERYRCTTTKRKSS